MLAARRQTGNWEPGAAAGKADEPGAKDAKEEGGLRKSFDGKKMMRSIGLFAMPASSGPRVGPASAASSRLGFSLGRS